jgi:hypothetical protein
MANKKKEKINVRKYVNWLLLMIAIVLVCIIGCKIYNTLEMNKLKESVLSRVVGTIQYEDIDSAQVELASNDFIFISYVKSVEVRKLETKLKDTIVDNSLQNNFYYLDATDLMLEENYIDTLNQKFNLTGDDKITALPALIYYKNGEFVKTISSNESQMMSVDDFNKLLDNYEITDSHETN